MAEPSLFRRVLGDNFEALPEPVKAVHDAGANLFMVGKSEIETKPGVIAWLVCAVIGDQITSGERWIRTKVEALAAKLLDRSGRWAIAIRHFPGQSYTLGLVISR